MVLLKAFASTISNVYHLSRRIPCWIQLGLITQVFPRSSTVAFGEVERVASDHAETEVPGVHEQGNGSSESQAVGLIGAGNTRPARTLRARALEEAWDAVAQARESIRLIETQLMRKYGNLFGGGGEVSQSQEPPSKGKEKDLREWGALGILKKELEVEEQWARLEEYQNSGSVAAGAG
ncbi:hypothetical protein CPB84DRAFT_1827985 [Gymnopilus junonius]|uniref:Uncharacterized protein n=1 Tax=Gymnopilus junonius TaxID=109634 RepID=A0A9P5NGD5_GYMJU|nr:hypothetical protein CPB84DRAFT_1827985 [Gymnopilus junonius]